MGYEALKQEVLDATLSLPAQGLVTLTWGNVSKYDREAGVIAIKPSGVPYADLVRESIVVVDPTGTPVEESRFSPSVDLPIHLALYGWLTVADAIVHTHSTHAVSWAQRRQSIPCLGTTHADYFSGDIPCTRELTAEELQDDYTMNSARSMAEAFQDVDPALVPAVLSFAHGPFVWGPTPAKAVERAVALEKIAEMANLTLGLGGPVRLPVEYVRKHYESRLAPNATYGQHTCLPASESGRADGR